MTETKNKKNQEKVGFTGVLPLESGFVLLRENLEKGISPVNVTGLCDAQKAHFALTLICELKRPVLFVTHSESKLLEVFNDIAQFTRCDIFRAKEMLTVRVEAKSHDITNERMRTLERLVSGEAKCVVTTIDALMQPTVKKADMVSLKFKVGEEYKLDEIVERLVRMGYVREDNVYEMGQFGVRGGILDVFSPSMKNPVRIEFFGDEVDSIREFDEKTQLSVKNIKKAEIIAAEEAPDTAEAGSLTEYLGDEFIVLFDEASLIREKAEAYRWGFEERVKSALEKGILKDADSKNLTIFDYQSVVEGLISHTFIGISLLAGSIKEYRPKNLIDISTKPIVNAIMNAQTFVEEVSAYRARHYRTIIMAGSTDRAKGLIQLLEEKGIPAVLDNDLKELAGDMVVVSKKGVSRGYEYPLSKTVVISGEFSSSGSVKKRRSKKLDNAERIRSFADISIGDYVVHEVHGIGRYEGMTTLDVDGVRKDYIKVAYHGTDCLYVPTTQLDSLHKYIGNTEGKMKLSRFGGSDWTKAKERVKASTKELAEKLIRLYAERERQEGYAFSPDTPWQRDFESDFEYVETDDQLRSIAEIKKDMEKKRPMDRLLCGDVGYGKTEVAMRAAFKAVMDGKQVAYLVPTTVLALQQYNGFVNRMSNFPVSVEMLSRFKTPKETKDILERLKNGSVDIIVGTHKLLGESVEFKDLGLLIVDEEQRFGVEHKERIKEVKKNVDVLTLTATPIPRTLHMTMVNIRQVSVLGEPPEDRYPIETYVLEHNEAVVADAIEQEVARGGQVYYLFNRIEGIRGVAARLKERLPDLNIAVAHGRMSETEIENIMLGVINGDIDVLVCTTIIETGIDVPNVNTIIIENADRLGLAQLYQLRGRVGRSNRRAYAYLTYRRDKSLSEVAQKRLVTIKEFTEFGSGFKIAMRDLEIRGAGNLLGPEQHGNMDTVGYEMYCRILEQAVAELKGEEVKPTKASATVDISVSAYISEEYIESESNRLEVYRRIADLSSDEDKIQIMDELCDRYGDVPKSVENLIDVAIIKNMAIMAGVSEIKERETGATIYTPKNMPLEKLALVLDVFKKRVVFSALERPYISFKKKDKQNISDFMNEIKTLLEKLKIEEK